MSDSHNSTAAKVLDYFLNPRNVGDIPEADGVGEVGAVSCGDVLRISIRVCDGRIAEARFRAYGCGTAIATSSMATELVKGRSLEEAAKFSSDELSAAMGGIPAAKAHCPVLAEEAIRAAVEDYRRKQRAGT